RLLEEFNLKVDEAVLTGESNPVSKDAATLSAMAPIAEQKNMCFANTIVTYGRAKGIVVATGMQTEFGKIAGLITQVPFEETPLKKKLEALGVWLIKITTAIIVVLFFVGVFYGNDLHEMFKVAVSLGVAAIPEGLPAVITITLGIGALQMAKNNALVRKMPSVETLGSVTVICSDKTGTLTRNEMVVEKVFAGKKFFEVTGEGYNPQGDFLCNGKKIGEKKETELSKLLEIAAECNDSSLEFENEQYSIIGDPTEGSLTVLAKKAGIKKQIKRIDEVPFESERKMMTTAHEIGGKKFAYSKGALEKILGISNYVFENGKISKLSEQRKKEILSTGEEEAKKAYRLLGFSFKEGPEKGRYEEDMVFVGFVAMRDPIREGVKEAVETTKNAGIKVKIITGDNPLTALAIGEKIGLRGPAITGAELDKLPEKEFIKTVKETNIFARVSPEHKFNIVKTLKESGEIVAVTGDGVNDAPALKKADIGIAMGIKGTDVSKEASDLILKDDHFSTIVVAVREGRRIYANIKSFVTYLLAANIGEVIIISISMLANFALPIVPLQLLWLNIVTDSFPALALGTDKGSKDEMQKKPRDPKEKILDNTKALILVTGLLATLVTFAAFFYGLQFDQNNGASLDFLKTKEGFDFASKARTMAFTTLVVFELLFVFSCRRENKGVLETSPFSNQFLIQMVLVSLVLQLFVIYGPTTIQTFFPSVDAESINVFDTVKLSFTDWAIVFALASTSMLAPYIAKIGKKNSR
ncbi:MAG: HAD-IC family P-type ATPase, partial [Candidatus Diapherotrites archaeon]|nr:HAD-IC family P-type ATPase [Candidatus Diapherotrites archaeon]